MYYGDEVLPEHIGKRFPTSRKEPQWNKIFGWPPEIAWRILV